MTVETPHRLTIAFMQSRPGAAARVLEDLDAADAAALLGSVSTRIAAGVLGEMPVWAAARCTELMDTLHAGAILRGLRYQDAASVLRLLEARARERILEQLPRGLAGDFRRSLAYPRSTVGAWMDQDVPTFFAVTRAEEVLRYARGRRAVALDHVFVLDARRRYLGSVSIAGLLKVDGTARLEELLDPRPAPVSNRAAVRAVESLADWDRFAMLPVIGRRSNVLGGLRRTSVREALEQERAGAHAPVAAPAMLAHLLSAYLLTLAAISRLILGAGSAAPREGPR